MRQVLSLVRVAAVGLTAACFAQTHPAPSDPAELIRTAVNNEIQESKDPNARFIFRSTKTTPRGSVTKVYVETKEATAGMVVAYDGKPLTPEQRKAEEARVGRFLTNPDELKRKRKQEQDDADRMSRILRALPDAFVFEYAGEQAAAPGLGKPGTMLSVLKFHPNPNYQPPSRVEQILTGMRGTALVDPARKRLASLEGILFKDVSFGWGILGHLDKGGRILLQAQDVRDPYWLISRVDLNFTGKLLLVKSLTVSTSEKFTHMKLVSPDLSFAEGLEMLKREEPVLAEEASPSSTRSR